MRKFLLFLVTSTLLLEIPVISTERDFKLSNEKAYQIQHKLNFEYFETIPTNPNVYKTTTTYLDRNLTKSSGKLSPNQKIIIQSLEVNDQLQPVFKLTNGRYLLASQNIIFDDIITQHRYETVQLWTKPQFNLLNSPIGNQSKKIDGRLSAYHKVEVTEFVQTPRGEFAKTKDGWIDVNFLSVSDNRMEKVQSLLNEKYNKNNYSIYVQQLDTGRTAGINQTTNMYSASVAKLTTLYYTQLQLDQGKLKLTDKFKYSKSVNDFEESYIPAGSGELSKTADNKDYEVERLIKLTAQKSDNVASNILSYYATNQFDGDYYATLDPIIGQKWNMDTRDGSAQMAGQVMAALYRENPTGVVLESLSNTAYDGERISKNIDVKVAHKIGDAYDFKHDVAIVYSGSPYVISIFTNHASYDKISNIADDVHNILK